MSNKNLDSLIHLSSSFSFKNIKMQNNSNQKNEKNGEINLSSSNKKYKPTLFLKSSQISSSNNFSNFQKEKNLSKNTNLNSNKFLNTNNYSTNECSQNNNENKDKEFSPEDVNDEIYPGEDFNFKNCEYEEPKNIKINQQKLGRIMYI